MIGSVFEQRDQLLALERRRQELAARQQTPAHHAPAVAAQVAAPIAGGIAAAGYAPAAALKSAEPDIGKRKVSAGERRGVAGDAEELREHPGDGRGKRGKAKRGRIGRDLAKDPLTPAHESVRSGENSRKAYQDRGATEGPGDLMYPGHLMPQSVDRDYLREGHASQSPQAEPPRSFPLIDDHPQAQDFHRGSPPPAIQMSGAPVAAGIPSHVAASFSLGSPSDR